MPGAQRAGRWREAARGLASPLGITSAPTLETERLILRSFTREDLDAHAAKLANLDVVRHLGGQLFNREDSWRRLTMAVGQWPLLGYGYWAVEAKADGRMVGEVGFADFERGMTPNISGAPEMGWVFDTSAHGQGIGGEAARAALEWIDRTYAPPEITAIISIENAKSMRLAERLGFVREPDAIYRDELIALFRRKP
ncbi:MAG: GNAT family protein [Sphingomicrobium sp.]